MLLFLVLFIAFLIVHVITDLAVFGRYLYNYDINLNEYRLNLMDNNLLYRPNGRYIAKHPLYSIFRNYYIEDTGIALPLSPLNKKIAKRYKELKTEKINKE